MTLKYTNRFDRIEEKLDKLDSRLDSIDVTLGKQHVTIADHIKRTEILEKEVVPLKSHMNQIIGAGKFIAIIAAIFTVLTVFLKYKF